jgi:hypothetical protein
MTQLFIVGECHAYGIGRGTRLVCACALILGCHQDPGLPNKVIVMTGSSELEKGLAHALSVRGADVVASTAYTRQANTTETFARNPAVERADV